MDEPNTAKMVGRITSTQHGTAADLVLSGTDLYDSAPCGLLTISTTGSIIHVNATFASWVGMAGSTLIGSPFPELLEPGARDFYENRFLPILHLQQQVREIVLSLRTGDGSMLPVLVNADLRTAGTADPVIQLAVFAAGERHDYERQLVAARRDAEASEARTRILQNATTALGDADTIDGVAHALAASAREAIPAAHTAVFLDDHTPPLVAGTVPVDAALLPGGLPHPVEPGTEPLHTWSVRDTDDPVTVTALQGSGVDTILAVALTREARRIGTLTCYFDHQPHLDQHALDLLEALCRQAAQALARLQLRTQLAAIALYDPLTGLTNRFLLRSHITAAVAAAIDQQHPLALLFVDLDDFKSVNDDLDHTAGDTVLKLVAARLTAAVRSEDLVCRYGGDEFIIVCQNTDHEEAATIAERVRIVIKQPFTADGWQRSITASVGVTVHTTAPTHLLNGPDLLRVADKAMYRSKDRGKDTVTVITY
ncbi:MAG: diguanylate cyclase [Leifsonia sp.]